MGLRKVGDSVVLAVRAATTHMPFAGVPFQRRPLSWHIACAMALVACVAIFAIVWHKRVAGQSAEAATALLVAQRDLDVAQLQARTARKPARPVLLEARRADDMVADVGVFAGERAVRVVSLQIERSTLAPGIGQLQVAIRASGEYGSIKSWLSDLLAKYPSLTLHSLSMRAPEGKLLESSVALTVYIKAAK